MGSRYSISSPLANIKELIKDGEKYAFIGKPCDVLALRNYSKINSDMDKAIIFYLSFFLRG